MAEGRETVYSSLEMGFWEDELWILLSAVSGFWVREME
jgi:hypothetical protein